MSDLTFTDVAETSAARCKRWHGPDWRYDEAGWTGADWSNAMCGEAGEAANVVKKIRRLDLGLWGNRKPGDSTRDELIAKLGAEIADTFLYMDLLATYYGIDIPAAIVAKFNAISEAAGFPERLPADDYCTCTPAYQGALPSATCPVHGLDGWLG